MPSPSRRTPGPRRRTRVLPRDPGLHVPTPDRPLRAKLRRLAASTVVEPHSHPWAQVAMSDTGVIRLTAGDGTYLVPPSRAVWVPPDVEHVVTVLEDAEIRTLYVHPHARFLRDGPAGPAAASTPFAMWPQCRVLEVSPLLRELVLHLDLSPGPSPASARERRLADLVLDELRRAAPVRLGLALPADKRLRALCEAMLDDPLRHGTLEAWAQDSGATASARTLARLFRQQLGTTFGEWRQQLRLAQALALASDKRPMSHIAAELGYASASAFSAMVRRTVGTTPRRFLAPKP
jgi:AraC-like DNA-binding protein/quercetin dioxygenase-like cupin family protein